MTRKLHHNIGDDVIYRHMTLWLDREHVDIYWQPPPPRNITHEMYYYTKYGSLPSEQDGRLGMSTARTSSKYLLSKILKLRRRNGCMYTHICPDPSSDTTLLSLLRRCVLAIEAANVFTSHESEWRALCVHQTKTTADISSNGTICIVVGIR